AIQNGTSEPVSPPMTPKIGITLKVPAGKTVSFKWAQVGLPSYERSVAAARAWWSADWKTFRTSVATAAAEIPLVETGNPDWDLVLASSYNRVIQSVLKPALQFSGATMVSGRTPELGFSRRSDGSDHHRMWEGQDVQS